jgi:hypothetical protein
MWQEIYSLFRVAQKVAGNIFIVWSYDIVQNASVGVKGLYPPFAMPQKIAGNMFIVQSMTAGDGKYVYYEDVKL